jgi:hypothetical protein
LDLYAEAIRVGREQTAVAAGHLRPHWPSSSLYFFDLSWILIDFLSVAVDTDADVVRDAQDPGRLMPPSDVVDPAHVVNP